MKQFEIGKTYELTSIANSDFRAYYRVIARTACTVTVESERGGVQRLKISRKLSEFRGAETVSPWGVYSMSPELSADSECYYSDGVAIRLAPELLAASGK